MSPYFRVIYVAALLLTCFLISGCYCGPRQCATSCCPAPCGPAACGNCCGAVYPGKCPQPVCYPLSPGTYSQTMHPAISEQGTPFLIPQSELKSLMAP